MVRGFSRNFQGTVQLFLHSFYTSTLGMRFPLRISWFSTWFRVTAATLGLVFFSVLSLLMVAYTFLLFLVRCVPLMSSFHFSLLSTAVYLSVSQSRLLSLLCGTVGSKLASASHGPWFESRKTQQFHPFPLFSFYVFVILTVPISFLGCFYSYL